MSDFIRARSEEQFQERRDMIMKACEEIYSSEGFLGVTFEKVSKKTTFTRPALYNYYPNREEMLMDLFKQEHAKWIAKIMTEFDKKKIADRAKVCDILTNSLLDSRLFLKLIMDEDKIESGCCQESRDELSAQSSKCYTYLMNKLSELFPDATEDSIRDFLECYRMIMYGINSYYRMNKKNVDGVSKPSCGTGKNYIRKLLSSMIDDMLKNLE